VCIKYLLATPPKSGSRPSEGRNSRLKTTTRRSINPLRKFYAMKVSCIHGGRNYKATGKVRKRYVLFLSEKKRSSYVLLGKSRHLRPTFLCNERACVSTRYNSFVESSAVRGLRLWHVLKENCGTNVWNLKSYIYACRVIRAGFTYRLYRLKPRASRSKGAWPSSAGGQWCPAPLLNSVSPHFMFGPPNYHEAVELLCAVVDSQ